MPDEFIRKVVDMPNMEVEVQLCGDDEYFAEGALIELQQASKKVKAIDVGKAERGRKNEGSGPAYRLPVLRPSLRTRVLIPTPSRCLSSTCKTAKNSASQRTFQK